MNNASLPDPSSPIDAEASSASTKPKTSKGSRWWSVAVGLLLAAALVLFALDRLGVRLPGGQSSQTNGPTPPGSLAVNPAGNGATVQPAAEATVTPAPTTGAAAALTASPAAKPPPTFGSQQTQIQMLIGQVQALPSLANPPSLVSPTAPTPVATPAPSAAPSPAATPEPTPAPVSQDPLAGPSVWTRLADGLSELFVVRRVSPSAQPMLDEAGDRLARQELRLLLLSARMSLMMEQPRQARTDLMAAQGLLPKFFRTEEASVQAFAEQLTTVLSALPGQP